MKPNCKPCLENAGMTSPAEYLAPQSRDAGKTINTWVLVCRDHHCTWWDGSDWVGDTYRLVVDADQDFGSSDEATKRVVIVVEGGIADWVSKPDEVQVDIYDFDGLGWLSRDQRDELKIALDKGNSEQTELALHLTDFHYWSEYPTDLPALEILHAELHEQTDYDHEYQMDDTT